MKHKDCPMWRCTDGVIPVDEGGDQRSCPFCSFARRQDAKLAKVLELRDRLQQTMPVMTDGNRAWATTIVHELTAILEAE